MAKTKINWGKFDKLTREIKRLREKINKKQKIIAKRYKTNGDMEKLCRSKKRLGISLRKMEYLIEQLRN